MNHHFRPSPRFKPIIETCAKPAATGKLHIPSNIGGWLLALLLATGTFPAAGQMATAFNGKLVGTTGWDRVI